MSTPGRFDLPIDGVQVEQVQSTNGTATAEFLLPGSPNSSWDVFAASVKLQFSGAFTGRTECNTLSFGGGFFGPSCTLFIKYSSPQTGLQSLGYDIYYGNELNIVGSAPAGNTVFSIETSLGASGGSTSFNATVGVEVVGSSLQA